MSEIVLGYQVTATFEACNRELIADPIFLLRLLGDVAEMAKYDSVSSLTHSFTPHGVTCVLILTQSHMIAHSWPEHNALIIDVFACGEYPDLQEVMALIKGDVKAANYMVVPHREVVISG